MLDAVPADWKDRLRKLDCIATVVRHDGLTADIVRKIRTSGYRVLCFTPNDPARVSELASWEVDTIITDAVDHIAADSLSSAPPL